MNIATTLRYVNLQRNSPWDERYYIMNDYSLMANKYGICLCAIMTPHGCEEIAERLFFSGRAVRYRLKKLLARYNIENRAALEHILRFAIKGDKP